jgi:peroxin-4
LSSLEKMNPVKRLQKEAASLKDSPDENIKLTPINNNVMEWKAIIRGPKDSAYYGFEFELKISVPQTYPMQPPVIKFITKIFHPNVHFEV